MWICTKCETFNEETSLVCCVCGNRRVNTDAKCDTTVLESNFRSSMEDADSGSSKKHDHVRMKKPDRETYKIKEGQDSAEIPKELRPQQPEVQEAAAVNEPAAEPVQEPQSQPEGGAVALMPEPQPFSENNENPFGSQWNGEAPVQTVPPQPQNVQPVTGEEKSSLLPLVVAGLIVVFGIAAAIFILLN